MGDLGEFYTDVVAADRREPWAEPSARHRLGRLKPKLPFSLGEDPTLCPSNNNDVWLVPAGYLRVAWRGDRARLGREARLCEELSGFLPVPEVLDQGGDEVLSWSLSKAIPGQPLSELCHGSEARGTRPLLRQTATWLRALHAWAPPAALLDDLCPRSATAGGMMTVIGSDLVVLGHARIGELMNLARRVPFVDEKVVDSLAARVSTLPDIDPLGSGQVIHGDFYLNNVIVRDGQAVGLIDFEFARRGPADLELISVVRAIAAERNAGIDRPPLLDWLSEDYPELFAAPDLNDRLWLYAISYTLRHVIFWPPDQPEQGLDPGHPLHLLRRLVDEPIAS